MNIERKPEQIALDAALAQAPQVRDMLSAYGRRVYFAKGGVLGQTWEAREKAYALNATLGEAKAEGRDMAPVSLLSLTPGLDGAALFPYAKPAGLPELRALWREKARRENPLLADALLSLPVVTCGLTHALSLMGELFIDPGDAVVVHDQHWENYEQIFAAHFGAQMHTYPTFAAGRFNWEGLQSALEGVRGGKALVILNFPNNPTGYCLSRAEAEQTAVVLRHAAARGLKITVLADDAYYGLWYDQAAMRESLAGALWNIHPNLLVARVDGATKEFFAGGFRVGFLTFLGQSADVLDALAEKAAGAVRAYLSSASRPAQELALRILKSPQMLDEVRAARETLAARGRYVLARLARGGADWTAYPFRGGYFCCLRMQNAPAVRRMLLDAYGMGVIAINQTDLRISFPCLEIAQLETLFNAVDEAARKAR